MSVSRTVSVDAAWCVEWLLSGRRQGDGAYASSFQLPGFFAYDNMQVVSKHSPPTSRPDGIGTA